jgi:hypothetical protein
MTEIGPGRPVKYPSTRKPGILEKSFTFRVTSGASSTSAAVAISRSIAAGGWPVRRAAASSLAY